MDKVLLIENSGMTFRCDVVPSEIKESTSKTGMMILKGVPATVLDQENGNGRRYTKKEMQKAIRKAREGKLFENRRLLCTADDHPEESFPAPIKASHVVIDAYTKTVDDKTVLMNDWLVFNTSKGKDLQGLIEGGASFGTSIRGLGQYNEDTKEVENYDFLGCDAVGNPSAGTFASKEQFKVTVESVEPRQAARIREQLEDTMPKYDLSEKINAFREKHLKDGVPVKITRQMTEDLLTMQRECVEAGQDISEIDALSNEIYGEQADPPPPPEPKPVVKTSNQERDILNRAQRELEATQNLAVHLKDQVTELETSKATVEEQLSAYQKVAESLQEQIDEVIRESDETKNLETARLVRKVVSTVNGIQREAYEVIKSLEARLESAIRIGDVAVDSAITLRRIADSLYNHQLRQAESAPNTWKHSRTKQAAIESNQQNVTESKARTGNRAGWI
jgi:soluble cytochrome b562